MKKYEYWNNNGLQSLEEIKPGIFIQTKRSIAGGIITLLAPERKRPFSKKEKNKYYQHPFYVDFFYTGEKAAELIECFTRTYNKAA